MWDKEKEVEENFDDVTDSSHLNRKKMGHTRNLLLKGQMKYIQDIDAIVFLCSPM